MKRIVLPLFAGILCLVSDTGVRATSLAIAASPEARILTFAERVAYQRAMEEVYWRHRIWPKENPYPKPSFDAGMSQAQLENKVTDYLRNSQELEDCRQRPLTADQLQAEMNRMAEHTRQPQVLRELFAALGNDPFVVAECLARPVLTERLVADLSAQDKTTRFESAPTKTLRSTSTAVTFANLAYTLPRISVGDPPCTDDTWTPTSILNAPAARRYHTAIWTGSEMIVWGGQDESINYLNTGGIYSPSTDSWVATSISGAPSARIVHTAVWTGVEMIVWGGNDTLVGRTNTGGRYNPSTNSWTATSTTNAPIGRAGHTAVWTGSEMIVWGGIDASPDFSNTGGRYNPSTDSWTATSTANAPSVRVFHTAVWSGSEMIVWGGFDPPSNLHTGGRYNPSTNSWTATSTTQAPSGREYHTAVWTGSEMIVWGGADETFNYSNTGGRYNPNTNSWATTSTTNAPVARDQHTAVWNGKEMIIWGGIGNSGNFNTGGRYDPVMDTWTTTSTVNAPLARYSHTAVSTGNQMIVWGGTDTVNYFKTGGRYCAPGPPSQLGNISTRAFVQTGDNVVIGGFIVQGNQTKRVIIRAIGPELGAPPYNVPNPLYNPTLELHDSTGALIASNDDWHQTIIGGIITASQVGDIEASGYTPGDGMESAIIADLTQGNYTAIVTGVNNMTGVALVEVYDLSGDASSILGNISTRSFVQIGDNVMIGGFIVQGGQPKQVIIRAIGPELGAPPYNVPNALPDPTLELHDGTGALIASNDNWQHTIIGGIITGDQVRDIVNSGHAPTDPTESAIIAGLPAGNYTAIVRGVNNTTGVALVEVYDLGQ